MRKREMTLGRSADRKLEWGVAAMPIPGESASGDLHVVCEFPGGILVAVIDALGHGAEASAAAHLAAEALERHPGSDLWELLLRCNRILQGTRGVVMSLASISWRESVMTWIGVGDVAGVLVPRDGAGHAAQRETVLLTRGGIVGAATEPTARPWVIPLADGDTLIFATDGIRRDFISGRSTGVAPQRMADEMLQDYRKGTDDALVLVARYSGDAGAR